jgi:hypothetical protein
LLISNTVSLQSLLGGLLMFFFSASLSADQCFASPIRTDRCRSVQKVSFLLYFFSRVEPIQDFEDYG